MVWKPADSLAYSRATGGGNPYVMTAVMAHRRANVVALDCMWRPRWAVLWAEMGQHFDAWWGERGAVIVECAMDVRVCGYLWTCVRWAHEVEGEEAVRNEFVPKVQWECRITGTQPCNQVIF